MKKTSVSLKTYEDCDKCNERSGRGHRDALPVGPGETAAAMPHHGSAPALGIREPGTPRARPLRRGGRQLAPTLVAAAGDARLRRGGARRLVRSPAHARRRLPVLGPARDRPRRLHPRAWRGGHPRPRRQAPQVNPVV